MSIVVFISSEWYRDRDVVVVLLFGGKKETHKMAVMFPLKMIYDSHLNCIIKMKIWKKSEPMHTKHWVHKHKCLFWHDNMTISFFLVVCSLHVNFLVEFFFPFYFPKYAKWTYAASKITFQMCFWFCVMAKLCQLSLSSIGKSILYLETIENIVNAL